MERIRSANALQDLYYLLVPHYRCENLEDMHKNADNVGFSVFSWPHIELTGLKIVNKREGEDGEVCPLESGGIKLPRIVLCLEDCTGYHESYISVVQRTPDGAYPEDLGVGEQVDVVVANVGIYGPNTSDTLYIKRRPADFKDSGLPMPTREDLEKLAGRINSIARQRTHGLQ